MLRADYSPRGVHRGWCVCVCVCVCVCERERERERERGRDREGPDQLRGVAS